MGKETVTPFDLSELQCLLTLSFNLAHCVQLPDNVNRNIYTDSIRYIVQYFFWKRNRKHMHMQDQTQAKQLQLTLVLTRLNINQQTMPAIQWFYCSYDYWEHLIMDNYTITTMSSKHFSFYTDQNDK